jgi:hypothetical protein
MKKILTGTIRSVIITIANLCFLCGAGYLADWYIYLYTHSKKRIARLWQSVVRTLSGLKTAPFKRPYTK